MTDEQRIGDKDLPFKDCEGCGASNVPLHVVDGDVLCEECSR